MEPAPSSVALTEADDFVLVVVLLLLEPHAASASARVDAPTAWQTEAGPVPGAWGGARG